GLLVAMDRADRDDLGVEPALVPCPGGARLALRTEGVEVLARQTPLVGDELGGDALGYEAAHIRIARAHARAEREAELAVADRRPHRHHAHDLDTRGDDDVVGTRDDGLRAEVRGLLRRAALPVD